MVSSSPNQLQTLYEYLLMAVRDDRVKAAPLDLLLCLLICWQEQGFPKQIRITRKRLMLMCKFSTANTYHKYMQELIGFGYIQYKPTYDYYKGTKVTLLLK